MTWDELKDAIERLPIEEQKKKAIVFDYATEQVSDLEICMEGERPFHLTIH